MDLCTCIMHSYAASHSIRLLSDSGWLCPVCDVNPIRNVLAFDIAPNLLFFACNYKHLKFISEVFLQMLINLKYLKYCIICNDAFKYILT